MVLPEHPSDTKVFTMKMEILLEPTFNKLLVVGFNPLVHSFCALSTLRRSGLRTASAAAKPCQGDSLEFYLITGSIYTDKRGTVVLATLFNESEQRHFRVFITNIYLQESRRFRYSDACYHDPEKCEHAGPKGTVDEVVDFNHGKQLWELCVEK
ncbi:hypothetical protein Tco_1344067 [Tanacetum coccineum]